MKRYAGSEVRISQLKAQLSEHLRAVRLGREIIIKDRETPIARLTPLKPEVSLLPFVPATRSMAEVERMLDAAPRKPVVPRRVLERIAEDNKKDVYDKWTAGELT